MQVLIDIPESKRPGIAAARAARNASLPAQVQDGQTEEGVPIMVANPALLASDEAYITWVIGKAVDSYNSNLPAAPAPAPSPDPVNGVPQEVSARQAHDELIHQGLHDPMDLSLSEVQKCINRIADPVQRALIHNLFHKSAVFQRQKPEIIWLWTTAAPDGLGRTLPQLDQTFVSAAAR